MNTLRALLFASAVFSALPAVGQTTNLNLNLTFATQTRPQRSSGLTQRMIAPFGLVAVKTDLAYLKAQQGARLGPDQGTVSIVINRLDSFDIGVEFPNGPGSPTGPRNFTANITGGRGAYKDATGALNLTFNTDLGGATLAGGGSVVAAGRTTSFTLNPPVPLFNSPISGDRNVFTGNGTVTPIGNATANMTFETNNTAGNDGILTVTFNATDSMRFHLSYSVDGPPPPNTVAVCVGGTGAYAAVTGSITLDTVFNQSAGSLTVTGAGSITTRPAGAPTITEVSTADGPAEIAQNTFIVIKGRNLVPATTSKDGVVWSNAPEFASGRMPTVLQGIGVKVNDVPAYVYFFCSAATNPACASDQINVLTPLDNKRGQARVTVSNNGVESAPFAVSMQQVQPALLTIGAQGHVAAVHVDGSLVGPASLYPGFTTPARRGETILVFAVGFGLPTTPLVQGSATQFGPIPQTQNPQSPTCTIGTAPTTVAAATLISPGLYQFNIVVPSNALVGDNLVYCQYSPPGLAAFTPPGNLLAVQ